MTKLTAAGQLMRRTQRGRRARITPALARGLQTREVDPRIDHRERDVGEPPSQPTR